jgi:hypothetical protein
MECDPYHLEEPGSSRSSQAPNVIGRKQEMEAVEAAGVMAIRVLELLEEPRDHAAPDVPAWHEKFVFVAERCGQGILRRFHTASPAGYRLL